MFHFLRPLYRIDPNVYSTAVFINIPTRTVLTFFRVDRHYNALTAEFIRRIADQLRRIDRRRVNGNLICPFAKKRPKIIDRADSSTDSKWNENTFCHFSDHIDYRFPLIGRRRNIKKYKFIRSCRVICLRDLHRVSGIFQTYKVDSFYDPSVFYIQTGNNSLCKHHIHLL